MTSLNYSSLDKRVNQQVSANKLTGEIRVNHYINLKVKPISAGIPNNYYPDLDDVKLVSCETFSSEIKEEEKEYEKLMEGYGFKAVPKGKITIFKFRTVGDIISSDCCIPLPIDRPYWILSSLPHAVVTELSPDGDPTSTAKGEALGS